MHYGVGTNNMQYTIRAIPPKLDKVLRYRTKRTNRSLNEVVLESLAKGAGVDVSTQTFHDLDWFVGSMDHDTGFDEALKWLDSLPKDMEQC